MSLFVSMTLNGSHGIDIENQTIPTIPISQNFDFSTIPNIPTHNILTMSSLDENIELCNLGDDINETWLGHNV